ncbi:hypothetical protein KBB96_09455 [Luteolibacter ambystomatis]|uniref:Uncharacterized protein n=1 Tax=Luteolibacter ambystomatis TaxID=2824561 RepID=A0A975J302_9BACT|nr:hypothetical protein [Luteolibacter ambystomatis]QUE53105.1 hypothetical protein KBB96_09455 [Luteolibacter ambystomatis]
MPPSSSSSSSSSSAPAFIQFLDALVELNNPHADDYGVLEVDYQNTFTTPIVSVEQTTSLPITIVSTTPTSITIKANPSLVTAAGQADATASFQFKDAFNNPVGTASLGVGFKKTFKSGLAEDIGGFNFSGLITPAVSAAYTSPVIDGNFDNPNASVAVGLTIGAIAERDGLNVQFQTGLTATIPDINMNPSIKFDAVAKITLVDSTIVPDMFTMLGLQAKQTWGPGSFDDGTTTFNLNFGLLNENPTGKAVDFQANGLQFYLESVLGSSSSHSNSNDVGVTYRATFD